LHRLFSLPRGFGCSERLSFLKGAERQSLHHAGGYMTRTLSRPSLGVDLIKSIPVDPHYENSELSARNLECGCYERTAFSAGRK
jgi:hypothetical protein